MIRDTERNRLLMMLCAGAALALATLGCGAPRDRTAANDTTANDTTTTASGRAPARDNDSAMTDVDIAAVVLAANSSDSANGALAVTRTRNAAVREFAQRLVRDHGQANQRAKALATRLNVTPVETEKVRDMNRDAADKRRELQEKSAEEFDRAFLDHEVDAHQNTLETLDRLIPAADNADLRQLLTQARTTVQSHLDQARQLQQTLQR
jgi:putative membrane protein